MLWKKEDDDLPKEVRKLLEQMSDPDPMTTFQSFVNGTKQLGKELRETRNVIRQAVDGWRETFHSFLDLFSTKR